MKRISGLSPLRVTKKKAYMVRKFMEGSGIKGYHVLLRGAKKIPADDVDETQEKEISSFKLLNLIAYKELILAQEDKVCFKIVKEEKKKGNKYGDARLARKKLSRKFEPTTGASNTILHKKCSKYELYDKTRNPE